MVDFCCIVIIMMSNIGFNVNLMVGFFFVMFDFNVLLCNIFIFEFLDCFDDVICFKLFGEDELVWVV